MARGITTCLFVVSTVRWVRSFTFTEDAHNGLANRSSVRGAPLSFGAAIGGLCAFMEIAHNATSYLPFVARVEAIEGKQGSQRDRSTFKHVDFELEEAGLPPAGYRDHLEQFSLMRGLRLKAAFKGGEVCSEACLGRRAGEQGSRGAETVPTAISAGVGFTLGGDWSTGFGAVGACSRSAFFTRDTSGSEAFWNRDRRSHL
jgi:hypothetical protein